MELQEALSSIAESLREERTRAGLTLEQLAERADLSTAHLSRLESGDRQPSVASLIALSRALGRVDEHPPRRTPRCARHRDVSADAQGHEANGLTIAPCSGFPGSTTLQALHITINPDRVPPEPARHRGEEWVYVMDGRLRLEFDGQAHDLEPGSTAHFDASRPHRLGALGGVTQVLVVAADGPTDFRNHPLFSTSITDH